MSGPICLSLCFIFVFLDGWFIWAVSFSGESRTLAKVWWQEDCGHTHQWGKSVIFYRVCNALTMYVLWFNFILGLNFIFFCLWVWQCMIMSLKQKKIKFKPRIKLNHNICMTYNKVPPSNYCMYAHFRWVLLELQWELLWWVNASC